MVCKLDFHIVGTEVTYVVLDILNGGKDPSHMNHTFICLIPKVKKPKHVREFRPISLCNVVMKSVTKTMANGLKPILPNLISEP